MIVEQRLSELASQLDLDPRGTLADDVLAALDAPQERSRHRAVTVAALLTAAALALILIVPGPRHAVARWFGIGSTRIEAPAPDVVPATFPQSLDLGPPLGAGEAAARTSLPVPSAAALGKPAGIYVSAGQVVVAYRPSAVLPASPVAGVGALLSTLPRSLDVASYVKVPTAGTVVETITFVNASGSTIDAVWLAGEPHSYYSVDPDGNVAEETLRLATNTLLWQDGPVSYRLEASISRDRAVEVAATVVAG